MTYKEMSNRWSELGELKRPLSDKEKLERDRLAAAMDDILDKQRM